MSPNLRRALHQALDVVLDALADEASGEPVKRRRPRAAPPPMPAGATPEDIARVSARLALSGYKKTG